MRNLEKKGETYMNERPANTLEFLDGDSEQNVLRQDMQEHSDCLQDIPSEPEKEENQTPIFDSVQVENGENVDCSAVAPCHEEEKDVQKVIRVFEKNFSGGFFLFLCIFQSACALLSVACLDVRGAVVGVLISVSMWMTYSYSVRGKISSENRHMKLVSGSLCAMRILNGICFVLSLVLGLFFVGVCLFSATGSAVDVLYELLSVVEGDVPGWVNALLSALNLVGLWGALVITCVMAALLAYFWTAGRFYRNCVRGTRAIRSIVSGEKTELKKLKKLKKLKSWLLIFGVMSCLVFTSIFSGIFLIVTYIFLDKIIDDLKNIGFD